MAKLTVCQFLKIGYISQVSVHKIGNDYFNTEGLMRVLDELDAKMYSNLAMGEKLTATETLMLDILISIAGYNGREDFAKSLNKHNSKQD